MPDKPGAGNTNTQHTVLSAGMTASINVFPKTQQVYLLLFFSSFRKSVGYLIYRKPAYMHLNNTVPAKAVDQNDRQTDRQTNISIKRFSLHHNIHGF